jgi:hypothetical protein
MRPFSSTEPNRSGLIPPQAGSAQSHWSALPLVAPESSYNDEQCWQLKKEPMSFPF